MHAEQEGHWKQEEKTWKWEVVRASKKDLRGNTKEVLMLMKTDPVFSPTAKKENKSFLQTAIAVLK